MDEKQISELLECSVCLERLDQTCKVLPCQHTFCRRCLDEILFTKHELRCPECRALVTVRVADLPTNILVVRILEGLKTRGVKPPSSSSNGGGGNGRSPGQPKGVASSSFRRDSPSHFSRQGGQPCAKALYNYESEVPEDLKFKKGDIINLKRQIDDNWFQGELSGNIGHFPANFVQVLVPLMQIPQCKALYDFDLKDEGEKDCLSFKKDETLTVIRRVDENWVEGRKGDKIGIFPLVFVEVNDSARVLISTKSNRSIVQHSTPVTSGPTSSSAPPATLTSTSALSSGNVTTTTTTSTTAAAASATQTSSTPSTPQRSVSAQGRVELTSGPPPVPGLAAVPHVIGTTEERSALGETSASYAPQGSSGRQATGTVAAAAEPSSSPVPLTSSDLSLVSSPPSLGEPSEQTRGGEETGQSSASTATACVASETTAAAAVSHPQNKRHSYTPSSVSSPAPSSLSSSLPSCAGSLPQNRHSAEITLSADFTSTQVSSVTVTNTPTTSTAASEATASLEAAETQLKAAAPSPKHKQSSSPTAALSSDSSVDPASPSSSPLSTTVYTALYSYRPQKDDELELTKGEQYAVTEKCQDGWFKGSCLRTGQAGVFPGNYVHLNRHASAFKPVHPNILNIRAKGPQSVSHSSHSSHDTAVTGASGGGDSGQAPPPLLPRVAKMGGQGQRSKSPAPLRSMSHPATSSLLPGGGHASSSRLHVPGVSPLSSSHLAGVSAPASSTGRPPVPDPPFSGLSQSHHHQHAGQQKLASLHPHHLASSSHRSALPTSPGGVSAMSATASVTQPPPNVVMGHSHHSAAPAPEKEKKEKKEKEKKGLVKLFGGKGKKNKQAQHSETSDRGSDMAVLCFDNVAHIRSGSYPAESCAVVGETSSLVSGSHHRKAASFDAASSSTPPVPAKPRPKPVFRERYCCIVPYPPQTEHELCLELGDIIHVHRKREDGWYKGTQERTGKTGLFPGSFVEKM